MPGDARRSPPHGRQKRPDPHSDGQGRDRQGKFEQCGGHPRPPRKNDPKNAEADYLSGVIYQRWQQPDKALQYYQAAVDKAPTELAYLMAKVETLVAMGQETRAWHFYRTRAFISSIAPSFAPPSECF